MGFEDPQRPRPQEFVDPDSYGKDLFQGLFPTIKKERTFVIGLTFELPNAEAVLNEGIAIAARLSRRDNTEGELCLIAFQNLSNHIHEAQLLLGRAQTAEARGNVETARDFVNQAGALNRESIPLAADIERQYANVIDVH